MTAPRIRIIAMPNLTFRQATEDDIRTIIDLTNAGSVYGQIDDPANADAACYREALAAIAASPHNEMIVAEHNGKVVGCMQISRIPGITRRGQWRGLLENVHIRADRRGEGLGTEMIQWAIERCRDWGCGMVQLTSNKARLDAHRFYKRLGFEASHEGFKLKL